MDKGDAKQPHVRCPYKSVSCSPPCNLGELPGSGCTVIEEQSACTAADSVMLYDKHNCFLSLTHFMRRFWQAGQQGDHHLDLKI